MVYIQRCAGAVLAHESLQHSSLTVYHLVISHWWHEIVHCGVIHTYKIGQDYKSGLYFPPEKQLSNIYKHTIEFIFPPSILNAIIHKITVFVNMLEFWDKRMSYVLYWGSSQSRMRNRHADAQPYIFYSLDFFFFAHNFISFPTHML